jgi:hypothetical protein
VTLVAAGHVDTVRRAAESYGPEAAAAVELLVGKDLMIRDLESLTGGR